MISSEIRQKFLDFFKQRKHAIVKSSSLIPDDPSVLFTTAGMQQFKKYYTGELNALKDFGSKNTVSIQKCFRTSDIDEVGDESHLTFFEMLGNFSFGGYFKKEAIEYAYEFITKEMGLKIEYATIFDSAKVPAGDWRKNVPFDEESEKIWKKYGVEIKREGTDVFWGPTGEEGPCGPTTEIYVKSAAGKAIEIWNIVFNEFFCDKNKKLTPLKTPGIDTGMGLERLTMVVQKKRTVFDTDLFEPLRKFLPSNLDKRINRIFMDHVRGAAFLISDGVIPSNKDQGYVLRKLLRRMIAHVYLAKEAIFENSENIGMDIVDIKNLLGEVAKEYKGFYGNLDEERILSIVTEENKRFQETLRNGIRELVRMENIDAKSAFKLYESYGLPYEIIKELTGNKSKDLKREDFEREFKRHQEISRAGAEKKFGGHGITGGEAQAEDKEKVVRLHTATHLLQAALRQILGDKVSQKGSDINPERLRFDFSFDRKLTPEEIKKVEDLVNEKIKENLPVNFVELPLKEAMASGALHFFNEKYPDKVKIYFIGKDLKGAFSKEFCGGPHVKQTGEIGKFKIIKEEGVQAGVRRIRAVVED